MSSVNSKEKFIRSIPPSSIKTTIRFQNLDELKDMFLEKFIAMNPLYLIDEEDENDSYENFSIKSDFSSDI